MSVTMDSICFGDVIKLEAKSAHVEGNAGFLGFLEQKTQMLLVVPPVKEDCTDKFHEAEFIVAPIRGEKQPVNGTPLTYKQPFVLRTSDGSGYALNNKTPNLNDVISLQPTAIKGEMYVTIEKDGFTSETHVHDGDIDVEINVVDSNRIRKKYNKTLTHFTKPKSEAPGGFVCCGSKGQTLTFKLCKVPDKHETRKYVKEPIFRRASQELLDPVKADETSEASVLESPSRAGSIVASGVLLQEDPASPVSPSSNQDEASVPMASEQPQQPVKEAETPAKEAPAEVVAVEAVAPVITEPEPVAAKSSAPEPVVAAAPAAAPTVEPAQAPIVKPVSQPAEVGLSTIELSGSLDMDAEGLQGSMPVSSKLVVSTPTKASMKPTASAVVAEEVEATVADSSHEDVQAPPETEEPIDTPCVGKCSIM
ncbi:hypothetical protein Poli38472_005644 [Pythium oligandrum]|uniref:Uncharacterized protein n=1 Tax=Pythium oligandrum TaxID=41045 RepID=A0A8K1CHS6_PYTOL|nr:hypothetical protein Poli38472_005644 [Pythium oligandrum]|eukprot:TMW63026.1 hypothetical protein Poli38472_005644 [Pythium oligandrum]